MKEKYLNYWLRNPDASDAEYQDWLHSQELETQEDKISEHDAWWNSLTEEEKQKIADEHKEAEDYFNKNR